MSFHLVSKTLSGSGGVAARVASQTNTAGNPKAGVMLRASTDPASAYYAAFVTPAGSVTVEERATSAATIATPAGTAPAYLWVRNDAGTVTTYGSSDGYTWTAIPGSTVTLNLGPSLLAGLAVTSNDVTMLNRAKLDSVVVGSAAPAPASPIACPLPWSCADIGNPTPAGSQSYDPNTGTWTLIAGGADITGSSDQFHFVWQRLAGDGSISARAVSQTNTSSNAKAGVMLRASSAPGAPNYAVLVSPGAGIKVQVRRTQGGTTTKLARKVRRNAGRRSALLGSVVFPCSTSVKRTANCCPSSNIDRWKVTRPTSPTSCVALRWQQVWRSDEKRCQVVCAAISAGPKT